MKIISLTVLWIVGTPAAQPRSAATPGARFKSASPRIANTSSPLPLDRVDSLLAQLRDPSGEYIFVVAHRGDWRNAPENSLQGVERAILMGVDMVEVDVRLTKDSVPRPHARRHC
jgi:hypothetical protein